MVNIDIGTLSAAVGNALKSPPTKNVNADVVS
jgi:hypothetical protein